MRPILSALSLLALTASVPSVEAAEDLQEVLVISEPYARWDNTRWRIDQQIMMPYPVVLYAETNAELHVVALDTRMILACQLGAKLGRKARAVDCVVEDAAITAAPWYVNNPRGQRVIDEADQQLTGLHIELRATADGRIEGVSLIGEPQAQRRVNVQYENLRQIVRRGLVGFHLRAGGQYTVGQQWREKNSALMSIPAFRRVSLPVYEAGEFLDDISPVTSLSSPTESNVEAFFDTPEKIDLPFDAGFPNHPFDTEQAPASYGTSFTFHRMDAYADRFVVQSKGQGVADLGENRAWSFQGTLEAVSVYEPSELVMTERVWTVQMDPTAGSGLAFGVAGWPYKHTGRLVMLGDDEVSELGRSALAAPPATGPRGQLPAWPSL